MKNFLNIKLKCIGEGNIIFSLRAVDARINGNRFPVYINYGKFTVNGIDIFNKNKIVWLLKPYLFELSCDDGEIFELSVEWKPI